MGAPPFLGLDLRLLLPEPHVGIRLGEPASVEVGGQRLANGKPLVGEVGERLERPHEPGLDLVEAAHPLAVVLRPGNVARIELVAVLLVHLNLLPQFRQPFLLTVRHGRAGGKPGSRQQRQRRPHAVPRAIPLRLGRLRRGP